MAYPPLVPITGPYGTYQIPGQVAGAFGVPEPVGPPPTFQPGELEGAILGDVPSVAGTEPLVPSGLPTAAPPPMPLAAPPPPPQAAPDFAPSVTRGQPPAEAPQPFVTPDEQAALDANRGPGPQPQPPAPAAAPGTLASMYANLEQRKDIAQRQAALKAETADKEAAAYEAANAEEARLTKLRDAEREQVNKELGAARAKQASAMDAFVNHKVDEGRLWKNMSTSRKIFAGIGVALSGLGNALAKKGGAPNPALDIIMGAIKDDVRMQLADRDRLGQIVGMRKDAVNDLRQQYADGEAAYNGVVAGLTRRTANQVAAIAARAKSPEAKLAGENFAAELNGEADKIALDAQERDAAARQRAFQNRMALAGLGEQRASRLQAQANADRAFKQGQYEFEANMGLRAAQLEADANAARAAGDVKKAELLDKRAKEERELGVGTGYDGKSLGKAPSPAAAERLRPVVAAGANAARLIDGIKRVRAQSGSEWFKTPEARQLKADMGALIVSVKNTAGLGALAGPDMELIEKFVGTTDATETDVLDSMISGLDRARSNLIGQVRSELSAAQVEGASAWSPPDLSKIDPKKTDADIAAQAIKAQKTTSEVERAARPAPIARGIARAAVPIGDLPADASARKEALARSDWELPGVTKEAATGYRALAALATGKDPAQAQRAKENLLEFATTGNTEQRLAAIQTMRNAGLTAEADAAISELPQGVQQFVGAREAVAPKNDNVSSLESAARGGDAYARITLAQIARAPGPEQKAAGEALIRLQRGGAR